MALTQLTKIDGRGINTTSDYRVGILTAIKFVGPFDGTGGNFAGVVTATDGVFSGNVTIGGTLTYEDVTNIDSVGIITARDGLKILAGGANVVGVVTASGIDCNGDIDVDGHTNLDNVSVAGVSTFAGDVVIADSIVHDGDPNTKIRFPTDDNISFEAGATGEVARFLPTNASSGGPRMGLGTNNPTGMLHIYGANPPVRIQNSIDSANLQIGMWDGSHVMLQASNRTFKLATETTNHMVFHTGGLAGSYERLRITSGGTINIGGNYSHTSSKLQITGNSTFNGDINVDGHTNLDNVSIAGVTTGTTINATTFVGNLTGDVTGDVTGAATRVTVTNQSGDSTCNVLFTQSATGNQLPHTNANLTFNATNGRLTATSFAGDGSNLTGIISDKIYEGNTEVETVDTGSDGLVRIKTEGVERLRITNNGNIGVGNFSSINPARKVHLHEASANTAIYATFTNGTTGSAANNGFTLGIDSAQAAILNNYSSTDIKILCNGSERLRIDNAGRLSLGVSASPGSYVVGSQARQVQAEFKGGISGNAYHHGSLALNCTNNNANLYIVRSQNIQTSGVALGSVVFNGYDGTDFHCGARITVARDATGGNNNIPCRFEFLTTADGESQPTERVRITSAGVLKLTGQSTSFETAGITHHTNNNLYIRGGTTGLVMQSVDGNESWVVQNDYVSASTSGSERLRITSGGNVNIGGDYTQTTYTMKVTGSFAATTKSFVIDHPTKENHSLRYACLEGPENSVYVRGKTSESVIELPDYWKGLVHEDSITVNVTPIGNHKVWVEAINNNSVTIGSDGSEYFYTVFAERKDVDKLEVEVAK